MLNIEHNDYCKLLLKYKSDNNKSKDILRCIFL